MEDFRSRCLLCDGTGWRYVQIEGERNPRVTRCECRRRRQGRPARTAAHNNRKVAVPLDFKSAAAGDNE